MSRMIFVNLPVSDLQRSVDFWRGLGFDFNPQFTDDKAACMVVSDLACVMLLSQSFFSTFTKKEVADTATSTEAIMALSSESREEVDRLTDTALASGGSASNDPQDEGFMYSRSFQDPDGHLWEVLYMDPSALEQQPVEQRA
ncbi:MAG TPA: VOC family protein [Nocardioidaceae bacterium]|nr:VOC family protein [Nocardioidaceae bacterium]